MEIDFIEVRGTWRDVADSARTTIGMDRGEKEPTYTWKKKILLAEHSPIRQISVRWKWMNLKSWISVHFVRHKIGIEHFVKSQRTDRTGVDRDQLIQSALVNHECVASAQSIITISRKRLCRQASDETRNAWKLFLDELSLKEPVLTEVCVPECVYRGFCPELKSCGYYGTTAYLKAVENYRKIEEN